MEILQKPLTQDEVAVRFPDGMIEVVIAMDLDTFLESSMESIFDQMEEQVLEGLLGNISYTVVGHDGNTLFLQILGENMPY